MRVLHVINSLSGSGGAEHGLVREAVRFGPDHEQLVVTLFGAGPLRSDLVSAGVHHRDLGLSSSNSGWNWMRAAVRLRTLIDEFRPDVLQSSLFVGNLVAQLAARRSHTPVLSTLTLSGDVDLHRSLQPGANSWYARRLRAMAARLNRYENVWFRALTNDARDTNVATLALDRTRVRVIPRGVPATFFGVKDATRSSLGLPDDVAIVLNVARQVAQKGQVHLVTAFERLLGYRSAHLVIVGREGDMTDRLRSMIESSSITRNVTIVPYTERVVDYHVVADVFAFPSLMEGLGTAVLEAMASGLPIVAFDIPPVREITGNGRYAHLVPVGDAVAFSDRLAEVLDGRPLAATRNEVRSWARDSYGIDIVAARVRKYLDDIVLQSRSQ